MAVFFLAGFESTAGVINHTVYELAKNKEIQARLQAEIDECFELNRDGTIVERYEALTKLPYFDAVLKEAFRKHPVATLLERILNVDGYKIDGIELEKGTRVEISLPAVHMSEIYWDKPEEFRPERFFPENKDKIIPYSYLPFGDGPRNCVGMRFAVLEVKVALANLVRNYNFDLPEGTPDKFTFQRALSILKAEPFPIIFKKRNL